MIVVDASAIVDALLDPGSADPLFAAPALHAPDLIGLEVLHALRRLSRAGAMTEARAGQAGEDLALLRLVRHAHRAYEARVWTLRHNFTAYDGVYVALAEALEATLVTSDDRLARAAQGVVAVTLLAAE